MAKIKKSTNQKDLPRPPVVALMGHVDHGKTSLLDAIQKSTLCKQEHGGITQHITAYQIACKGEKITFIDTPGHAAFANMRSRGAKITDLVILVVAADDGIKPQTKECIQHIKKAKLPFLVAVNKIDLPSASIDKVKKQLAEENILVEDYGGEIVSVPVSAKTKKGIPELLELTLLLAQMQELKAKPNAPFKGIVIDSILHAKKGPLATILVKQGTLKVGQTVWAENIPAKIKALEAEKGQRIKKAHISQPVKVLGFKQPPPIGSIITLKKQKQDKKINIILKADTKGTLEALKTNLPDEIKIIKSEVGQPREDDIHLASSLKADIIAFNLKVPKKIIKSAKLENVNIKTYRVIYKLLEELEKKVLKILEPTIDEKQLGKAKIIAEFNFKKDHVAGCKITKGALNLNDKVHLKRDNKIRKDAKITSLQIEGEKTKKAKAGQEAGLVLKPDLDFKIGDVIISYKILD